MLATTIDMVFAFYVKNNTTNLHTKKKFSMCGAASSFSIYSQRKDVKQIYRIHEVANQSDVLWY
jgi:hypothetical protein